MSILRISTSVPVTVQILRFKINAKVHVGCHQSYLVPSDPTGSKASRDRRAGSPSSLYLCPVMHPSSYVALDKKILAEK